MVTESVLSRRIWRGWSLLLVVALLVAVFPAAAQEVQNLEEQEELVRDRDILTMQQRIRLLNSQGKYVEAIREAEALLAIDPNNSTALMNKDIAERRLAAGETGTPDRAEETARELTPVDIAQIRQNIAETSSGPVESGIRQVDIAAPARPTPAPAPVRSSGPSLAFGLPLMAFIIGGAVLLLAIVLIVLFRWMRGGRREAPLAPAPAAAATGLANAGGGMPAPSRGYVVHDQVTAVEDEEEEQDSPPAAASAPTEPALADDDNLRFDNLVVEEKPDREQKSGEFGNLGIDYSSADDSAYSASQADDAYQTKGDAFASAPAEKATGGPPEEALDVSSATGEEPLVADTAEQKYHPGVSSREDIDISAAAEPPAEETISLSPIGDESSAPPRSQGDQDAVDISQTAAPLFEASSPSSQPHAPESSEQDDALTFNSLMFGGGTGETEEKPAAAETDAEKGEGEDLTLTSFDREYSSVMFGEGVEETKMPGVDPDAPAASHQPAPAEEEQTVFLNPMAESSKGVADSTPLFEGTGGEESGKQDISEEKTVMLDMSKAPGGERRAEAPKAEAEASESTVIAEKPKQTMFERQRTAGKAALEAGEFGKAVQCLSVAASLKPSDKEVRAMLEEARKKRRGL